jgi:hypothetical protein
MRGTIAHAPRNTANVVRIEQTTKASASKWQQPCEDTQDSDNRCLSYTFHATLAAIRIDVGQSK